MKLTTIIDNTGPVTQMTSLRSLVGHSLDAGFSISVWRLPDSTEVNLIIASRILRISPESLSIEDSDPGFLISPFDRTEEKYFLPAEAHYTFNETGAHERRNQLKDIPRHAYPGKLSFHFNRPLARTPVTNANDFQRLVTKCVAEIEKGTVEKLVPSRHREIDLPENCDLLEVFDKLCAAYPQAFVTITSTPETGTWIGASPELLVHVDKDLMFSTTALAATKVYNAGTDLKAVSWNQKEIEEQALVSRYIINCFKKIRLREFDEHGPRTVRAGNLLHLKTDLKADMQATNFLQLGTVMLGLLHPTSAVCGMPLEPAFNFLIANENYQRRLYSGYLGPVNVNYESQLFVNLRCMEVRHDHAVLYAGAGVTIDSVPELEWEETVSKMNTLQQVILS
jgi:isochorismate synthase